MTEPQPVRSGDSPPDHNWYNGVLKLARRIIKVIPPLTLNGGPDTPVIGYAPPMQLDALITGRSGSAYSWVEAYHAGGEWLAMPGGRSGTSNAYELNLNNAVPTGTCVELRYSSSGDYRFEWVRGGSPPPLAGCDQYFSSSASLQMTISYYEHAPGTPGVLGPLVSQTLPLSLVTSNTAITGLITGSPISSGVVLRSTCTRFYDAFDDTYISIASRGLGLVADPSWSFEFYCPTGGTLQMIGYREDVIRNATDPETSIACDMFTTPSGFFAAFGSEGWATALVTTWQPKFSGTPTTNSWSFDSSFSASPYYARFAGLNLAGSTNEWFQDIVISEVP